MHWVSLSVCCRFVESVKAGKDFCRNLSYAVDAKLFSEALDAGSGSHKVTRASVPNRKGDGRIIAGPLQTSGISNAPKSRYWCVALGNA